MSKLVTLRVISGICTISNSTTYDMAEIDGWSVVVPKGKFKQGDLIIFVKIGTLLPTTDIRLASLGLPRITDPEDSENIVYHVLTQRINGELSQGLILSLEDFPEVLDFVTLPEDPDDFNLMDFDLTEVFHAKKYRFVPSKDEVRGTPRPWPSFIPKFELQDIEDIPDFAVKCLEEEFQVSIKLDGLPIVVYCLQPGNKYYQALPPDQRLPGEACLNICCREGDFSNTDIKGIYAEGVDNAGVASELVDYCEEMTSSMAVYGVLCGKDINGNRENLDDPMMIVYAVYDLDRDRFLTREEREIFTTHAYLDFARELSPDIKFNNIHQIHVLSQGRVMRDGDSPDSNKHRKGIVLIGQQSGIRVQVLSKVYLEHFQE